MHLATGAFDPGRGYTSPPGLEPHVVDLPQRSGCLEEENAKTQRRKDAKVVDLSQRSWRFGLWRLEHLEGPSSLDATNCHQTMLQCAFPADSKESCR